MSGCLEQDAFFVEINPELINMDGKKVEKL
jgi:hypothetical protein